MKFLLKVALGLVAVCLAFFLVAVGVAVLANRDHNERVAAKVANATSQVVIEAPAHVEWKGTIGGVEQTGHGPTTLDVPDNGTDATKAFEVHVQKTTPGDDLITVILSVDGEEYTRQSTTRPGSEITVRARVGLRK